MGGRKSKVWKMGGWKLKVESVKDGRGGGVEGSQAESEGETELEGGRQGGETSDKSILNWFLMCLIKTNFQRHNFMYNL